MPETRRLPTIPYGEFSRRAFGRSVEEARIIKAQLELTYRCNLHCRHCYTDPYNAREFFPRDLAEPLRRGHLHASRIFRRL